MNTLHAMRPFVIRPVILAADNPKRATFRTATCNYLYLIRSPGSHDIFGPTPDFSGRLDELVASGRAAPVRGHHDKLAGQRLWREADRLAHEIRPGEPAAWHIVGSLPCGLDPAEWREIVIAFCEDLLVPRGMITDWAIHFRPEAEDRPMVLPHVHLLVTARGWDSARKLGSVMDGFLRSHSAHIRHADAWYERTEMYPAPGFELRADRA